MLTKAELQRLRALREKKHREAAGVFVVEGEKVVGELLAARFAFSELFATPGWSAPRELPPGLRVTRVSDAEMARASHFPTPSTVLAVGPIVRRPIAPETLTHGRTLALDRVQDAGNVGTLLRIADWFGFDRVVLSPDSADLFHQKTINASMGSFARVAAHVADLPRLLHPIAKSVPVLGCDLDGDDVHALGPLADGVVVIGSEGRGLSAEVAACLSRRVTIPRYGGAESLNAAVAAAIVCAQLRRGG